MTTESYRKFLAKKQLESEQLAQAEHPFEESELTKEQSDRELNLSTAEKRANPLNLKTKKDYNTSLELSEAIDVHDPFHALEQESIPEAETQGIDLETDVKELSDKKPTQVTPSPHKSVKWQKPDKKVPPPIPPQHPPLKKPEEHDFGNPHN